MSRSRIALHSFALVSAAVLVASILYWARHRRPAAAPLDEAAAFALAVVEAGRSADGIRPEMVDDEMVERTRRMQLVKRAALDGFDPTRLLDAFRGESGPDRQYPQAERPQRQRERASRGLKATMLGPCHAGRWDQAATARVAHLVETSPRFPDEIRTAQAQLARDLAGAEAARVSCDKGGDIGVLMLRRDGRRRVVDLFPSTAPLVQVNPNDRSMK